MTTTDYADLLQIDGWLLNQERKMRVEERRRRKAKEREGVPTK